MNTSVQRITVWLVAVFSYIFAVVNRSSFTALGETAQHHFHAEATVVSTFVMVQLLVYALSQVPVGIFLDRSGATVTMTLGLVLMGCGQLAMGLSESVGVAIVARVLVGAGDACMFVSMIRVIGDWFIPRYIPTMTQISGLMGQGGQLLAVAPLTVAVTMMGWTGAFSALAVLAACLVLIMVLVMKDTPYSVTPLGKILGKKPQEPPQSFQSHHSAIAHPITEALPVLGPNSSGIKVAIFSLLKRPGVRLAFWVHMATSFATNTFVLLWGVPFMTGGLGYSAETAHTVVSVVIVAIMFTGLVAGPLFSRFARYRIHIVMTGSLLNLMLWSVILLLPFPAPLWLMILSALVMGAGGPFSMVAFEVVRSHAPQTQRGIATGIANMGGFIGSLIAVMMIGVILDLVGAGTPDLYNLSDFKVAMAVLIPILIFSISMVLFEYPKAKRYLESKGIR